MAEFTGSNEKDISIGEPIVFENKTECKFEVCAGVVFHKSGVYEVSILGNRTIVSEVPKRKTGEWIEYDSDEDKYDVIKCPCCKHTFTVDAYHWTDIGFVKDDFKFCPNCGAKMNGGEQE